MPFRVYDDRPEYATPEHFPGARQTIHGPYDDLARHIQLGPSSYCGPVGLALGGALPQDIALMKKIHQGLPNYFWPACPDLV